MNMKSKFTKMALAILFILIGTNSWSQSQTPLDIALRHIEENHKIWNLTKADIEDMVITDMYSYKKTGTTYIYFNQRKNGFKIKRAMLNLAILEDGTVNFVGKRFRSNVESQINTNAASINSDEALQTILNDLVISTELPRRTEVEEGTKYTYAENVISFGNVISELMYSELNGTLHLVWDVTIAPLGKATEMWNYSIDANTNQILAKQSMVLNCTFGKQEVHHHGAHCKINTQTTKSVTVKEAQVEMNAAMAGSYRVFPLPANAPNDGVHTLVTDPDDSLGSPFGWHDTDGVPGAEYTITRGNNVHAYLDRDLNGSPDSPEPDGGMSLVFDAPFDPNGEPIDNADAATINLFYMQNYMHDFSYAYGFDEAAGNYQMNNYGNGGLENDAIQARAQAGADIGEFNNAQFIPRVDGQAGVTNMFLWDDDLAIQGLLQVNEPASLEGIYNTGVADYGPSITGIPINGEVVEVDDAVFNPYSTDACDMIVNASELAGKIALVDRGGCAYELKTANAAAAGAIAVIICNFDDDPMGMTGVDDIDDPIIPTISIGAVDCNILREFAGSGLEVSLVQPDSGPDFVDGDFDNGIIAHEYAHGISHRLTGGPSTVFCLPFNSEEETMGEGWSDFFFLATTVKPGDNGDSRKGIGTYVTRENIEGKGIRRFAYSTDMNTNSLTYGDLPFDPDTHAVGEIWALMLWDLYWAMVEKHGFDNDQIHGDGGNNRTIQLVMEGMKLQPCIPGFVDGRDAILAADTAFYNGENACLIWDVFARRGCGINAEQGSSLSVVDQVVSFDALPTCIEELKITKNVTPIITAGANIDVSIKVTNHRDLTLTGVTVTEDIPGGAIYLGGSCSLGEAAVSVSGGVISFDLGTMEYLDEITFTYKLTTDANLTSTRNFFDDVENVDFNLWFPTPISAGAPNIWEVSEDNPYEGESSWYVDAIASQSQQVLQLGKPSNPISVVGANPVLRFFHSYNTEPGADGGVVEISTDGGNDWFQLGDDMFRGGYTGVIQYITFVIPNFQTFHGTSGGYGATYVDLSDYAGQDVLLRWHFASDNNTAPANGFWYVDAIELMDMVNYNEEACVTSDQGDEACASAEGRGTIVQTEEIETGVNDPIDPNASMSVFPNPTNDQVNLSLTTYDNQNVVLSIVTLDGKEVIAKSVDTSAMTQTFTMDVSKLPAGFYFVKARTNNGILIEKIVIR